ncbi:MULTISPECIES: DUF2695 domain-containing protein [unclassified Spirosoma]|uniref:DUF2695 domain-containing protein n=1 Tax=unclassified Spirosoma TaxID=2621999 RepID=UPI00095D600C|nr:MULTISPECIES: DUF2695 domain-containing protein [unclassified Spirosoma]MBN8826565.1 DUF2695 domain-containing protein [Spirosoma sp.]OJW71584.1 MAG: hypothetical protein BGO59_26780 [Spirosoma sp. 48-14]
MNEKDKKKALKNQFKQQELNAFRQSLPISVDLFEQLFDFLDEHLDQETGVDFSLTRKFCDENDLNFATLQAWLIQNGAGDDAEVLWNVEEQFEKL